MQPRDLFHVLAEVADEHARSQVAEPLVIPILIDELESRRPLLEEAAEFLGGVLLDATGSRYDSAIAAIDSPELRAEVQTGLTISRPREARTIDVSYNDASQRLDARLLDSSGNSIVPTAADQQLVALARSLFDERLAKAELAILLYSEHTLDSFAQAATLQMLTGLASKGGLRLGAARTLVIFVQGELSRGRHCRHKRGVRYSLAGDRLIERHPPAHLDDVSRKLVAPRTEPLVLFLGAGFSFSSGMPIGNALRDEAIRRVIDLDDPLLEGEDLARRLHTFAEERNLLSAREEELTVEQFVETLALEQVVRVERSFFEREIPQTLLDFQSTHDRRLADPKPLGDAVYRLRAMAERGGNLVLVTVNFDELIEHEHPELFDIAITEDEFASLPAKLEAMRDGAGHPNRLIPLLKLHGTISRLETCVVSDEVTRSGISSAKRDALLTLVRLPAGRSAPWVYVGTSMRDIDLDAVLSLREFNENASEYWVTPYPEETVMRFVASKERRWAGQDLRRALFDRTVTETSDAFLIALAGRWGA